MKYLLSVLCLLGLASPALAGPIVPTNQGCASSLPTGASWGHSQPFVFMAFYDPVAGCDETIRNPTGGFHVATDLLDGGYRIDLLTDRLPACGRIQFDAHSYLPNGELDPVGLFSLVFNTGIDCREGRAGTARGSQRASRAAGGGESGATASGEIVGEIAVGETAAGEIAVGETAVGESAVGEVTSEDLGVIFATKATEWPDFPISGGAGASARGSASLAAESPLNVTVVPEPATITLLASGLTWVLLRQRRKRSLTSA